jgi:hypothetical protein
LGFSWEFPGSLVNAGKFHAGFHPFFRRYAPFF